MKVYIGLGHFVVCHCDNLEQNHIEKKSDLFWFPIPKIAAHFLLALNLLERPDGMVGSTEWVKSLVVFR